jgi:2-keto-3-deoxy-L-rhamnonate aldolase RhmA
VTAIRNSALERLDAGELAIGVGLRQARTVDIGKIMKTCGFDWLFVDMEHSALSIDTAVQICVAAQDAGIAPIVRVPGFQHFHATRALDGGAQGVVVPHVDTPEMARKMVENCRYPPVGHRSVIGALPQIDFDSRPLGEATAEVNASTLLVMMIETPRAVDNADAIAAVEGVDALLVGTNDLCMEMGIPGQVGAPEVVEAQRRVVEACLAHGKHPGVGGVYDPPLMERCVDMGMRFILAGSDISFMMAAAKERGAFLRELSI